MQTHYSVLYQEEEGEMITYCLHKKIGSIPWARLAEGHLARPRGTQKTTRETTAQYKRTLKNSDQEIIVRVESRGKNHSVLKAQIAIPARLDEAIPGGLKLTAEEITSLEEPYQAKSVQGHL
ncbi:hypothetical protein FRB98_006926 [Tulasnella sp. 332]|nr:hypothetical protein FRB98_006926 [Tulasnella sp. 332]